MQEAEFCYSERTCPEDQGAWHADLGKSTGFDGIRRLPNRPSGYGALTRAFGNAMIALSRRSFLASSVAVAAHPALAIPAPSGMDVVIIGAGASGIAAARRIAAAGRKLALFEATDRVGGRCFTDTRTFGIPYDRGAHWIHMPDTNLIAKLGLKTGLD
jgi:hypothetical protein